MTIDIPDQLEAKLRGRTPGISAEWSARPAAVLVPLVLDGGHWQLLFTRRTENVETHRGQVSFPGGRVEAGDADPVAAALRETQEEIGVRTEDVRVLGRMDSLLTVTQYLITPVVGGAPRGSAGDAVALVGAVAGVGNEANTVRGRDAMRGPDVRVRCRACDRLNPEEARFCLSCGQAI